MKHEHGFSMLEIMMVVTIVGVMSAAATPSLTRALRSYRLSAGAQQIAEAIQTAKLRAVSTNQAQSVFFDTASNNNTIAVANSATAISLPPGIQFVTPTVAPPTVIHDAAATLIPNQQSDQYAAVSFPVFPVGSTTSTVRAVSFNWRGLPAVSPGAVNWIYLTNAQGELIAVTLSSAGSVGVWSWNASTSSWVSSKH